jgi:hypothetical protein
MKASALVHPARSLISSPNTGKNDSLGQSNIDTRPKKSGNEAFLLMSYHLKSVNPDVVYLFLVVQARTSRRSVLGQLLRVGN